MHHLLILHGWNHSSQSWQNASTYLDPAQFVLHIPDLPGFGQEPLISDSWSIPEYANWVKEFIQKKVLTANNQQPLAILGHSFGGRVAAHLASHNPPWLSQLILYGTPLLYRPSIQIRRKIRAYKLLKKLFGPSVTRHLIKAINPELAQADNQALGKIYRNTIPFDQAHTLPSINTPTLILHGTEDQQVSYKIAQEAHSLIPNSELKLLKGERHNIHLDNPNLLYSIVKKYLAINVYYKL
jgi:pimeloyl-ACP methyl ester carboxylesterase